LNIVAPTINHYCAAKADSWNENVTYQVLTLLCSCSYLLAVLGNHL